MQNSEIKAKRFQALKACCCAVFSTLFMFALIKYLEGNIVIEKSEWDLQTVTASDYTIELKLTDEQIEEWDRQVLS